MITFSLQSGSNGNAIYVEAEGVRLLFDAGISGVQAEARLACHGRDIRDVRAVILSHDHDDHVRCAGVYQRKYGVPVFMTRRTEQAARVDLGQMPAIRHFLSGDSLAFGPVRVHTVPTPHDAADGVAFVVEASGRRLGILTDLGRPFDALCAVLETLDAVYLESNYDPPMLAAGSYPPWLKRRIAGPGGHLSNPEAAELVRRHGTTRLAWLAIAHLSEENNEPGLALETHRRRVGKLLPIHVASRYEVSPLWHV